MGRYIAPRHAIVVTSDNPRGEDPAAIIAEIDAAIPVAPRNDRDRRTAIARAVASAGADDVVLIAGKATKPTRNRGRRLPFSDALEAEKRSRDGPMNELARGCDLNRGAPHRESPASIRVDR